MFRKSMGKIESMNFPFNFKQPIVKSQSQSQELKLEWLLKDADA